MSEAEWLAATDPAVMLEALRGASDRKLRAFTASACADRHLFPEDYPGDEAQRFPGDVARWVDDGDYEGGGQMFDEFLLVVLAAYRYGPFPFWNRAWKQARSVAPGAAGAGERARSVARVRCIFGNPFRPVAAARGWVTPTVAAIAGGCYATRDFSPLPVLADALQDAGCDSAAVLDHLRGPGPHVRGCWVVDLVLGKE
ncbi:hypothetical protein [Gemmata sp.]|uniref:hypothetical protein n=1 Tax=Gemmata sp. TaxID=1914242 RepID=UPI003F721D4B